MFAAEEDSEVRRVARACVDKFMAERQSLTSGTEKTKAERDTLAACI